jgi:cytochrome P450
VLQRAKRLLGEGLLTSEGDFHRRQRRIAQPAFHRDRIASYAEKMVEYAARTRERWTDGATVDIHQEMMRLTLAIVARTLFDADVNAEADEIGSALGDIMGLFGFLLFPFSEYLEKLPLPPVRRMERARERLDRIVYRIIDERRASGKDHGDLLSILLRATDLEGDGTGMTNEQLRDECLTLFLAGHETTANLLTWTWYLLSQNPEVERRFHEEVDTVLAGGLPTAADFPRLPFTEMVLAESMRLYPPAWSVARLNFEPYSLGPYHFPPRTLFVMVEYLMNRDVRWFPEPESFRPERWTPEQKAARPKFVSFPFGGGPRQCIGEGFAWMEGVLLLAALGQQWRMRLDPGQRVAIQPQITLRPKYGMRMRLERRAAIPATMQAVQSG